MSSRAWRLIEMGKTAMVAKDEYLDTKVVLCVFKKVECIRPTWSRGDGGYYRV
jgi:hypothetical protein